MSEIKTTTLKGFRKPRVADDIKAEIRKDLKVRLNIDIDKTTLHKLKIYLAKKDKTMKEVLTDYIDNLIENE